MKQKTFFFVVLKLILVFAGCATLPTRASFNDWNRSLGFEEQAKVRIGNRLTLRELDGQTARDGFWKSNGGGMGMWEKVLVLRPGNHWMTADLDTVDGFARNVGCL